MVENPRRYPKRIDTQVRCVCQKCNSTWMNALETEVRPIIQGLHDGTRRALSQPAQEALARWAVKTAVITRYFNAAYEVPKFYLQWFYEHRQPPPNTFVFVGTYVGDGVATIETSDLAFEGPDGEAGDFSHMHATVFTTGPLLVCVLTGYFTNRLRIRYRGILSEYLYPITPYQGEIVWPGKGINEVIRQALIPTLNEDLIVIDPP